MKNMIRACGRARNAQGWRKLGPRGLCGNSNLGQPPYTNYQVGPPLDKGCGGLAILASFQAQHHGWTWCTSCEVILLWKFKPSRGSQTDFSWRAGAARGADPVKPLRFATLRNIPASLAILAFRFSRFCICVGFAQTSFTRLIPTNGYAEANRVKGSISSAPIDFPLDNHYRLNIM